MPDTLQSPTNPNHTPVDVWKYPKTDTSPVADARDELAQHRYIDYMASDDPESRAVESGVPLTPIREGGGLPVDQLEKVPAPDAVEVYATAAGDGIDPLHAEQVLHEAAAVVNAAYEVPDPREQHRAALQRAQVYAEMVEDVRDNWLITVTTMEEQN